MEGQMTPNLSSRATRIVLALSLASATLPAFSARIERMHGSSPAAPQTSTERPASPEATGAVKFKQNCSRCHEAPQGFSSKISGTILRHMRVRASLSAQDERDILRFLNP
jgi:mono/diheme cytochrome c family protein